MTIIMINNLLIREEISLKYFYLLFSKNKKLNVLLKWEWEIEINVLNKKLNFYIKL